MTALELQDQLEELVDATSLEDVIRALSVVCGLKADHIAVDWQDKATSRPWSRAQCALDKAAFQVAGI